MHQRGFAFLPVSVVRVRESVRLGGGKTVEGGPRERRGNSSLHKDCFVHYVDTDYCSLFVDTCSGFIILVYLHC